MIRRPASQSGNSFRRGCERLQSFQRCSRCEPEFEVAPGPAMPGCVPYSFGEVPELEGSCDPGCGPRAFMYEIRATTFSSESCPVKLGMIFGWNPYTIFAFGSRMDSRM